MGIFRRKQPRLRSYVGDSLEDLLEDPEWAAAVRGSGIDPDECEVVLHLAEVSVGTGGPPDVASPAILFGQANELAVAYPSDHDIRVVKRDKRRGELQTQRSGWFQILFGPPEQLDGFFFWNTADNLQLGTAEGEKFGQVMSAFMKDQLSPQQVVGTPGGLVQAAPVIEPPAPDFDDPEDATRWKMLFETQRSLAEMMDQYQLCFDKAQYAEQAFAMANTEYVDGVRQHELSKKAFREYGEDADRELAVLLADLRAATEAARSQWENLVFLLPSAENEILALGNWCTANGIDGGVLASVVTNSMFLNTDYGATRQSFWTENERVTTLLQSFGQ